MNVVVDTNVLVSGIFLECAIAANAYYLVSGDSDLLVLEKIKEIPIITVNQFFDAHPEFDIAEG